MRYEINVSDGGRHFFATAPRSITSTVKLIEVYDALLAAFPPEKGFVITVTQYREIGDTVDVNTLR